LPAQNNLAAIRPRAASTMAGCGGSAAGPGLTVIATGVATGFRVTTSKSVSLKSFRTTRIESNDNSP
jgi:hypothetical protein